MAVPSGATSLGRVPVFKEEYSASTVYNKFQVVLYSGSLWICVADGTKGVPPVAGANWKLFMPAPDLGLSVVDGALNITYET